MSYMEISEEMEKVRKEGREMIAEIEREREEAKLEREFSEHH